MTATTDAVPALGTPAPAGWVEGTWVIDPAHSTAGFSVRHLMSRVRGTFTELSGQIITQPQPSRSEVTAAVSAASVSSGNQMRDEHLRSADFFDAGHYPMMAFTSTALRPADGAWVLSGDMTIRDVTRPAELEVSFLGTDPGRPARRTRPATP